MSTKTTYQLTCDRCACNMGDATSYPPARDDVPFLVIEVKYSKDGDGDSEGEERAYRLNDVCGACKKQIPNVVDELLGQGAA